MASGGEGGKVRTLELELGSRPRRLKKYLGRPQRSRFGRRLSRSTLDTGGNLGRLRENMQSHSLGHAIVWAGTESYSTGQYIQYSSTVAQ